MPTRYLLLKDPLSNSTPVKIRILISTDNLIPRKNHGYHHITSLPLPVHFHPPIQTIDKPASHTPLPQPSPAAALPLLAAVPAWPPPVDFLAAPNP